MPEVSLWVPLASCAAEDDAGGSVPPHTPLIKTQHCGSTSGKARARVSWRPVRATLLVWHP